MSAPCNQPKQQPRRAGLTVEPIEVAALGGHPHALVSRSSTLITGPRWLGRRSHTAAATVASRAPRCRRDASVARAGAGNGLCAVGGLDAAVQARGEIVGEPAAPPAAAGEERIVATCRFQVAGAHPFYAAVTTEVTWFAVIVADG
jgi:hypothetical protein